MTHLMLMPSLPKQAGPVSAIARLPIYGRAGDRPRGPRPQSAAQGVGGKTTRGRGEGLSETNGAYTAAGGIAAFFFLRRASTLKAAISIARGDVSPLPVPEPASVGAQGGSVG